MPVDCHIHMVLDGIDWRSAINRHVAGPDIPWIRARLSHYQQLGFTYLRDGGDRWGVGRAARSLAPEYGITYRTPLSPLYRQGHYGSFIGTGYESLKEYASLVAKTRSSGGDFIKVMVSGLMDFNHFGVLTEPPLPAQELKELVHIAHSENMAVMFHANGDRTIAEAAEAGVDSIEHGAYAGDAALQAMRDFGTVWVPTLSTVGNLLGKERFPQFEVEKILNSACCAVSRFAAMGGLLAPGTDAGAWSVPHGSLTEYALLAQAGVLPEQLKQGIAVIQKKFQSQEYAV